MSENEIKELLERLATDAATARKRMRHLDGNRAFDFVRNIFDQSEVVVGVWDDPEQPGGVGVRVLKGKVGLRSVVAADKADRFRVGVVPCVAEEQAVAAEQVFGERIH